MTSHPNRSKKNPKPGRNPTAIEIANARKAADLTQAEAAKLIHASESGWKKWETLIQKPNNRGMRPSDWELFLIKTAQIEQYLENPNFFKTLVVHNIKRRKKTIEVENLSTPDAAANETGESGKRGG